MKIDSMSQARCAAEEKLDLIFGICTYALDPVLTREAVVQHLKNIYDLVAPDEDDDPDGNVEDSKIAD
jgi:hypothetical protein